MLWADIWFLAKIKGISNQARTFMWRLLHNLLPSEQRLFRLKKTQSPRYILCLENLEDDIWQHSFSLCSFSNPAMEWMMKVIQSMDPTITKEKSIFLQIEPINKDNTLPCVWIISETLQYIWARRRSREPIDVVCMKASLEAKCHMLQQTKTYRHHATNMKLLFEI